MTTITVTHTGSAFLAKGKGKQRTVKPDLGKSALYNFGAAAGVLAQALGLVWSDSITHTVKEGKHIFTFPGVSLAK